MKICRTNSYVQPCRITEVAVVAGSQFVGATVDRETGSIELLYTVDDCDMELTYKRPVYVGLTGDECPEGYSWTYVDTVALAGFDFHVFTGVLLTPGVPR